MENYGIYLHIKGFLTRASTFVLQFRVGTCEAKLQSPLLPLLFMVEQSYESNQHCLEEATSEDVLQRHTNKLQLLVGVLFLTQTRSHSKTALHPSLAPPDCEIQRTTQTCSGLAKSLRDGDGADRERMVLAEPERCSLFLPAPLYTTNTSYLEKANLREAKCDSQQHLLSGNPSATLKIEMITVDRTRKLYWKALQSKMSSKTSLHLWGFITASQHN